MEPVSNDNGLINGISENNTDVGVVKKTKKPVHYRSSASSQGSSVMKDELTLRDTASSTSSSEEDGGHRNEKRRKKNKKQRSVIHRQIIDDDDERTDSAEEDDEDYNTRPLPSYPSGITFDPTPSILKPLSPSMLTVGYGAELMVTRPQERGTFTSPMVSSPPNGEDVIGSLQPHGQVTDAIESDSTPQILSIVPPPSSSLSTPNTVINTAISAPAANALPFAGWWSQHTTPIYSPFCGPSGSVATTPVATDATGLLRPGSTVLLRAIICQETDALVSPWQQCKDSFHSDEPVYKTQDEVVIIPYMEGVLIVNVQWRNKSYSGSLIDVSQHQWAPPRLMESYQDLRVQVKDLYSKQESEKEAVDVIIDEEKDEEEEQQLDHKQPESCDNKTPPLNNDIIIKTEETVDVKPLLPRGPNGLKVPIVLGSGITDKVKPIMPSFDAVKSPQPQIGRDDHEATATNRKNDNVAPETHHNFNTLVDVAAKMKHVSNTSTPPVPGNESDSSGSGSISPMRKQHQLTKDNEGATAKHTDSATTTTIVPFNYDVSTRPSSPPDKHNNNVERQSLIKGSKGHPWVVPMQDKDNKKLPPPSSSGNIMALNKPPLLPVEPRPLEPRPLLLPHPHQFPSHPPSVIQEKSKNQKRKRPATNEPSKRPSPPLDTSSPVYNRISHDYSHMSHDHEHIMKHDQPHPPPPGFQYDPSLPMPYDLQVVSYTSEMAANRNANTPPNKIPKRPHPPYEFHPSNESVTSANSRSPPPHLSGNKRTKNSPSVVMQPHGIMSSIKQEPHLTANRPSRPPSKGGMSNPLSKSNQRKGHIASSSRRSDHQVIKQEPIEYGTANVHQLLHHGGSSHPFTISQMALLGLNSAPPLGLSSASSLGLSSAPSSIAVQSQNPTWVGGVISNPSASQGHRKTPNDLTVSRNAIRTPSPIPHRKQDWPTSHSQQTKHESINRQSSSSSTDKHINHSSSSSSSSRGHHSNSGHHSNKHDPTSQSRHILASSHPIVAPPTLSPSYIADIRNGVPGVPVNDWLKQVQWMQAATGIVGPAGSIPTAAAIPTPQDLALWQNQIAMSAAFPQQLPIDQAAALQMHLALQHQQQQQQQQNEAVTQAFAPQQLFPLMQSFPMGAQVLPFPLTQAPKRET